MASYTIEQHVQMIKLYYQKECSTRWPFKVDSPRFGDQIRDDRFGKQSANIRCGDKTRTQKQVCEIINTKYPDRRISQSMVSRMENKSREFGNVPDNPKSGFRRSNFFVFNVLPLTISTPLHSTFPLLKAVLEAHIAYFPTNLGDFSEEQDFSFFYHSPGNLNIARDCMRYVTKLSSESHDRWCPLLYTTFVKVLMVSNCRRTHLVFFFFTPLLSFFFFSFFLVVVVGVLPMSVELRFCDCSSTTSSFFLLMPLALLWTFSTPCWNMPMSGWCMGLIGELSSFCGEPLYSRGEPMLPNMSWDCCSPSITCIECTFRLS
ncbi:hypothetical protein NQ318_014333 [Aromia moschata]|uniref:Uncharacterized protein n=1 Tax=Aromia moschata TaxID=1265417 RepID=A0AAV8YYS3_9CUCU|nr:hypothetical protein NQ318_014333 [Aromia moschata]